MKLYVGGAWAERERVASNAANLHDLWGFDIALEWWNMPEPPADDRVVATQEFEALAASDALLVIWPENNRLIGGLIEIGMAIAMGKLVVIRGHGGRTGAASPPRSVFWSLPTVKVRHNDRDTLEALGTDVHDHLERWARENA